MFGCLFGASNYANYKPIAQERGFPEDASYTAEEDSKGWDADGHSHTWIGYDEIMAIDWDEQSVGDDTRIHEYLVADDGTEEYAGKAETISILGPYMDQIQQGETVELEGRRYRLEPVTRHDALDSGWELILRLMAVLAEEYGFENVRMVVWFDN